MADTDCRVGMRLSWEKTLKTLKIMYAFLLVLKS
jgi:hypothetical protein